MARKLPPAPRQRKSFNWRPLDLEREQVVSTEVAIRRILKHLQG